MHIILVSFPIGKFVSVQVCIWIIPLLVCNWKSVEELTVLLVGNIACILGIPPTLRLLFCLPISNASLKDQKKKKVASHTAILSFKDNSLLQSVLPSLLF